MEIRRAIPKEIRRATPPTSLNLNLNRNPNLSRDQMGRVLAIQATADGCFHSVCRRKGMASNKA